MYINFWYPLIRREDPGLRKTERARTLGVNFAIFRDNQGQARDLSDACVHRGGSVGNAREVLMPADRGVVAYPERVSDLLASRTSRKASR